MTAQVLDLILIAVVLGSAFNGWRRGLVATIGSLAGAVVGALVAQKVAAGIPDPRSSLTPASVAWAESTTATRRVKGSRYSSSLSGVGLAARSASSWSGLATSVGMASARAPA